MIDSTKLAEMMDIDPSTARWIVKAFAAANNFTSRRKAELFRRISPRRVAISMTEHMARQVVAWHKYGKKTA